MINEPLTNKTERIQKILSAYGVASRREAERMILAGRILVNGFSAELGQTANPVVDDIKIDGKPLPNMNKHYYIMLNKPCGYITSMTDERSRKIVMELVADISDKTRIYPIGRLDKESEGLLLLTNDGQFANVVMHPKFGLTKTYVVHVRGDIKEAIEKLGMPIEIDSHVVRALSVKQLEEVANGAVIEIIINEGRNRQVRKMCHECGLDVVSLRRVAIGSVKLGNLPLGKWRHLKETEIKSLSVT